MILFLKSLKKEDRAIIKSTFWNLLDTLFTQTILIAHNIFLQRFIGQYFHGLLSTILALFYILIIVLNFGLDYTLPLFIERYSQDKKDLSKFIKFTILPQIILIVSSTTLITFLLTLFNKLFMIPSSFTAHINNITIIIIGITLISESFRKTTRIFLQLILSSKITALTETISTYSYIAVLWLSYLVNINITIKYCFILLLLSSLVQNILLVYAFYKYYISIPDNKLSNNLYDNFVKSRAYNMSAQISSQLFNSNFLIPVYSLYLNLDVVSNLKIYFSIAQFISLIIIKNLSVFLNVLFLYNQDSYKKLFRKTAELFYQALYLLLVFLLINNNININLNLIMLLIIFIEPFFIFYEKVFILEKKSVYISILNLLSILSSMLMIYNYMQNYFSLYHMLFLMLLIRIFNIIILSLIFLRKIKISINLKNRLALIFFSILLASFYKFFI